MPDPKRNFEAFAASLNEAGFKVTPKTAPWSPDYLGRSTRATAQVYLLGWTGDFGDPDNFVGTFFQDGQKAWGFDNPGDLRQARRGRDRDDLDARTELYEEANRMIMDFLPGVPYVHTKPALAFTANDRGLRAEPGLARVLRDRLDRRSRRTEPLEPADDDAAAFVVRRLLLLVPILIGLSILVFLWIRALPGGPAQALLGERATDAQIAAIERQYGLDEPIHVQYWRYVKTVGAARLRHSRHDPPRGHRGAEAALPGDDRARARGDALLDRPRHPARLHRREALRRRRRPREPDRLADRDLDPDLLPRDPPQVHLRGAARLAAHRRADRVLIDLEHPTNFYVLDALIAGNCEAFWDALKHLILPAIALGSIPLAIIARITRAAVLDVQNEDYVRTARAKGMSPGIVDRRHVLRNALLPIVTIIGLQVGLLLSGAVLTETVFAWPGIGTWLVDAIESRNYPVLQGGILFVALVFVLVNLIVDVSYAFLNPRIRLS